jgi:hypothetical protein
MEHARAVKYLLFKEDQELVKAFLDKEAHADY